MIRKFLVVAAALIGASFVRADTEGKIDFTKEIQPIFSEHCYQCHGPNNQEAGLRWDKKAAALKGGEHGAPIFPGRPDESLLIRAVSGGGEDVQRMPKKADPLSNEQVETLRRWVEQGASWPDDLATVEKDPRDHWAFKAPIRPSLPSVERNDWVRTPVDAFILARLEREGLTPSVEADRITLLRRLHLDLTGLPPGIEEVDAFAADDGPTAYAQAVDRLLRSPHYGERWGRHWLDAARYADSDGFEKDKPRFIWNYRDWVVNAFNRDLPYDKFIIHQLAGDQLPDRNAETLIATGFLRNSMLNEEGGVDPEQFRMDALFDRMDAIGKSVMGLTIQCAQCHTHKFDPITHEEYFQLFAFLNNDHESTTVVYAPEDQQRRASILRETRDLEEGLRHANPDWRERMEEWEQKVADDQPAWEVVRCENAGDNGSRFYYYDDGSVRAASYAPTKWTALFRGTNSMPVIGAFRLEQLNDPNLPCNGPGRSLKGMAALSEFSVEAADAAHPNDKMNIKFVKATADFANAEKPLEAEFDDRSGTKRVYGPIEYAIDGKDDTAWGIDAGPGLRNQPRKAVFIPEKPLVFTNGVILTFKLRQNHGGWNSDDNQNHNLGRFRLSVAPDTNAVADPLPAGVRRILEIPPKERSPAQIATVFGHWRATVPEFAATNEKIAALWKDHPEGAATLTLAARSGKGGNEERITTRMFRRGDWLKPGKEVAHGVPAILHSLPDGADDSRLTFARWLVDRRSPTAARVAVNRIWQTYFGTGLLETSEDFGVRAPDVSHPELLDWLATEFAEPGTLAPGEYQSDLVPWSQRHIHRLIVNSATYRQSSKITPELLEKDQFNRLLARGPRFRVEGEIVRDITLAASGLLNPKLGGPSVMPAAPAYLFQPPASYGPKVWNEETGAERYRRAIYTFRYRSLPYPVLQTFDAPNGDSSCVRRARSNTPLQALVSLNETMFMEAAQALARKTIEQGGGTDDERIAYAFRSCVSRAPDDAEMSELKSLLQRQKDYIAEGWVNASELATGQTEPPKKLPGKSNPTELAAYTVVARVLLNLDETITKE
jgi:mono/diheme cytochrome c family protein